MNGQSDCHKIHGNLGALTDRRVRKRGSTVFIEMDKVRHSVRISLCQLTERQQNTYYQKQFQEEN